MERSLLGLKLRVESSMLARVSCELKETCVKIAQASSPSAAFGLGFRAATLAGFKELHVLSIAKATRWLAVIRRDYGQIEFDNLVKTLADNTKPTV